MDVPYEEPRQVIGRGCCVGSDRWKVVLKGTLEGTLEYKIR